MGMWIAIGIAAVVIIAVIAMYNNLVRNRKEVDNGWAQIDVQLKRRCDLIPNLVETVKGYAAHEAGLLEKVTQARSAALSPNLNTENRIAAETRLTGALKGLMIQVEAYPELKASDNISMLQSSLNEIEAQLAAARRTYNSAVTDFNNAIQMFPGCLFASMARFQKRDLFEIPEAERQNVDVNELFKR